MDILTTSALDLINRQRAEIERMQKEYDIMRFTTAKRWVKEAKIEVRKEFGKMLIDRSQNGIIHASDIPDYVVEANKEG
jgi:hypothetical protein